jgi:hypothetical protein
MMEWLQAAPGNAGRLSITVPADRVHCFFPLLQKGFVLGVPVGCPVRALLRDGFGLTDEYIEARLQTVILDGKPVDDIDGAFIRDGATLALAPAMPGLMGATLRRGGFYAPMRSEITHRNNAAPRGIGKGRITMKLFGMALLELGPKLLESGIEVDAGDLARVVGELPGDCREGLESRVGLEGQARVTLRVTISQEEKK